MQVRILEPVFCSGSSSIQGDFFAKGVPLRIATLLNVLPRAFRNQLIYSSVVFVFPAAYR
jgi:hypothetical protein